MNGGQEAVHIVALGASTPLGRSALPVAAAVRAGISGIAEHPFMMDTAGEPMKVVCAPWLEIGMSMQERLEALLFPAIEDALSPLDVARDLKVGLALALPPQRPGLRTDLESALRTSLLRQFNGQFTGMATFPAGHAAGVLALDAAFKKVAQGGFDACVVAGVDSYLQRETLEWLETCDQLHSGGPLNNAWGFVPGEGAGAVCLMRDEIVQRLRLDSLGCILGVGTGHESKRIKTETVCLGEGLTQAFRHALQGLPQQEKVTDVYCDMNGEPYRADEYGFTCLRTKESFEAASDFVAPAECWGDVAAASVPLSVMLATIAGYEGYANGTHALVWASSEGGERGAVLINMDVRWRD